MLKFSNLKMYKYPTISIWIFLLFISCSEKKSDSVDEKKAAQNPTIDMLRGTWIEEKDSLHIIEFTDTLMIEKYSGSIINQYELKFFEGMPGKGGYEDPAGMVIQIEESKDNFHHFIIEVLNSNNLELFHRGAGQRKFYNRLKN